MIMTTIKTTAIPNKMTMAKTTVINITIILSQQAFKAAADNDIRISLDRAALCHAPCCLGHNVFGFFFYYYYFFLLLLLQSWIFFFKGEYI